MNTLKILLKEKQERLHLYTENIEEKIESLKSEYIEFLNEQAGAKNELNILISSLNSKNEETCDWMSENEKFIQERQIANTKRLKYTISIRRHPKAITEPGSKLSRTAAKARDVKNQLSKTRKNSISSIPNSSTGKVKKRNA